MPDVGGVVTASVAVGFHVALRHGATPIAAVNKRHLTALIINAFYLELPFELSKTFCDA
jgi:hypothetical protein